MSTTPAPTESSSSTTGQETSEATQTESTSEVLDNFTPETKPANQLRSHEIYDQVEAELKRKGIDPEQVRLDALAAAEIDDPIINSDENYKGIDYNALISSLPEDARKYVANLRSDYSRKTAEIAKKNRELDSQLATIAGSEWDKKLAEEAQKEVPDFDPYDQSSYEARIQAEVTKRMNEMMEPLRKQYQQQQAALQFDQFLAEHPDFNDLKGDVHKELKANAHLTTPQAYHIVRSRTLAGRLSEQEEELKAHKEAALAAGLKVRSGSGKTYARPPKGLSAVDLYTWFEKNS